MPPPTAPRWLALVSAPGGTPQGAVAHAAARLSAEGAVCCPVGDVPTAAARLAAQPHPIDRLSIVGHGMPGTVELGVGALHLRRHFLRADSAATLFTPAAVARLSPAAVIELLGCETGAQAPGLRDPSAPTRFDGVALQRAVAACCPGRTVRAAQQAVQMEAPRATLDAGVRVEPGSPGGDAARAGGAHGPATQRTPAS